MCALKAVDLFCGCGGLSLGVMNSGISIIAAYDNWDPALRLYKANFLNHPVEKLDLSDTKAAIDTISKLNPDLIVGGPPCQDFSSAGKRDESLGRANLTYSFAKIVVAVKPKYFIMENVERAKKSETIQKVWKLFKETDYDISASVLDASLCGAPQKRKRFFVVGSLDGTASLITDVFKNKQSNNPMTIREYFKDQLSFEHYYRHPRSYKRRGIFSIDEPSPTIRGVNRPIPQGYPGHPGDTAPISDAIHVLTTKERSLIQTFPKDFKLTGSKSELEQVVGNAVPVKLAEFVASCFLEAKKQCEKGFEYEKRVVMEQLTFFEQRARYSTLKVS